MLTPTILVLFGATGDLVAKKIVPALLSLFQKDKLPEHLSIVAFGRRDLDDAAFRAYVGEILAARKDIEVDAKTKQAFIDLFVYQRGQFNETKDYVALAERM
jgi:glucose-6-phosphate 1-dehydrogenase